MSFLQLRLHLKKNVSYPMWLIAISLVLFCFFNVQLLLNPSKVLVCINLSAQGLPKKKLLQSEIEFMFH